VVILPVTLDHIYPQTTQISTFWVAFYIFVVSEHIATSKLVCNLIIASPSYMDDKLYLKGACMVMVTLPFKFLEIIDNVSETVET